MADEDLDRVAREGSAFTSPPDLGKSRILLRSAQDGDREALNELFSRYYDRVYRLARIRVGAEMRSWMDLGDLTQEAFLRASRDLDRFKPTGHASIVRWLATLLINAVRDANRYHRAEKRDRRREQPLGTGSSGVELPAVRSMPRPSQFAHAAELQEVYDACVEKLDGNQREVVLLREYAGADWDEVAEALGCPNTRAAKELYRRARVRLGVILGARLPS